jgi:hypothetical protein
MSNGCRRLSPPKRSRTARPEQPSLHSLRGKLADRRRMEHVAGATLPALAPAQRQWVSRLGGIPQVRWQGCRRHHRCYRRDQLHQRSWNGRVPHGGYQNHCDCRSRRRTRTRGWRNHRRSRRRRQYRFRQGAERFPKAAQLSEKPPGFEPETWQWRSATRANVGKDSWDPEGGEWRYHPADKYHDPHWDHNPWTNWNKPWQHLYPGQ